MTRRLLGRLLVTLVLVLAASPGGAAGMNPVKAGAKEKCPVCGMFVAKYPEFAAQVRLRDGRVFHFDGAKDMFKFHLDLPRYAAGRRASDVAAIFVTDYYDLKPIDGRKAFYVLGSDVYGPMGRELVPFATGAEAEDFLKDHRGERILRFRDVTPAVLDRLE